MGRPLAKRYFGNRNLGTDGTLTAADAGIGGTGIGGFTSITAGSFTAAQAAAATLTFPAPVIADGITAAATAVYKTLTATINGTQTKAYSVTDVLTVGTGVSASTYSVTLLGSFTKAVTSISTAGVAVVASGAYVVGQDFVVAGGTGDNGTYYVMIGGAAVTSITLTDTYAHAVAATPVGATFAGGTGGTATIGATYSTITAVTVVTGGAIAASAAVAYAVATVPTNSKLGAGATITPATFGVSGATIVTAGDGYTSSQVITLTVGSNHGAAITATALVADLTAVRGGTTNREAAIIAYAYIGGSLREVDIVKQVQTTRYRVNSTSTGSTLSTAVAAKLKTTVATGAWPATEGVEMNIVAIDSAGGTYYVSKLTSRRAVLVPAAVARLSSSAGTQFAANLDGTYQAVEWTFNGISGQKVLPSRPYLIASYNVQIENG